MRRASRAAAMSALLALALAPACSKDEPTTELPCEFYEDAPARVTTPAECEGQIQRRTPTTSSATTLPS